MLMFLIFGGLLLSSVFIAGNEVPGSDEELESDHDDDEDMTGNLFDGDEGEEPIEAVPGDDGPLQLVEGTDQSDTLSAVGDGAYGDVVLDRGLFETSVNWDDVIDGFEGGDTIQVQGGHFLLYGGDDDDLILAEDASGLAFGGAGDDSISVSGSGWIIAGQDGNDSMSGGDDSDTLVGGEGSDSIEGGNGDDLLIGHGLWYTDPATGSIEVDDLLSQDRDTLSGGSGDDTIFATAGDAVFTGEGDDVMLGYIRLGQEPIHIVQADPADHFVIEIVVPEDFDVGLLDVRTIVETEDGGCTIFVGGYAIVHFDAEAVIGTSEVDIRVSFHDMDDRYLGQA